MLTSLFRHFTTPVPLKLKIDKNILQTRYQQLITKGYISCDLAQVAVLAQLQHLLNEIVAAANQQTSAQLKKSIESIYIFGDVGRGKSLLMELFFESCPILQKRRVHFHNFMLEVHEFIHQWHQKNATEPLAAFAKHLRQSTWLLCFDEFNVTDIADAMILTRLFNHLLREGFIFVATSNDHPDDLYKDGLQHVLFLPFINRLKQTTSILELVAKKDYRLINTAVLNCRFHIGLGSNAATFLAKNLEALSNNAKTKPYLLTLQGRKVYFKAVVGDILYSSFEELCYRALGSADYIKISEQFTVVFIADIPQLSIECRDQARRFVTLIDALYERNVTLIASIAVSIDSLYKEDGIFEFKRTKSRLMEMQSAEYMQRRQLVKSHHYSA